jgi:hypothetical protein
VAATFIDPEGLLPEKTESAVDVKDSLPMLLRLFADVPSSIVQPIKYPSKFNSSSDSSTTEE